MSSSSIGGLRFALLDPELSIHRSDNQPDIPQTLPEQWIQSICLQDMHL